MLKDTELRELYALANADLKHGKLERNAVKRIKQGASLYAALNPSWPISDVLIASTRLLPSELRNSYVNGILNAPMVGNGTGPSSSKSTPNITSSGLQKKP